MGIYAKGGKRLFDIVGAAAGLTLLSPLILAVAAVVAIRLGRPVLFVQQRSGWRGRPFRMAKFRSMIDAKDDQGRQLPDELRLPAFGRKLRATSLDELPALINVLKGEMSLVGPRPLHTRYDPLYSPAQARRLTVKPGITGWAQVKGRNALTWSERFELDVWYVDNLSFRLDLKIIFMTVAAVFARRGISAEGEATMAEFRGNDDAAAEPVRPPSPDISPQG